MMSKATITKKDLIVVLGCVVFLLANLGAVGSMGRRRAKEVVCLSNLHQWGVIWKSFAEDNKGRLIQDLDWLGPLWPYYRRDPKLLLCPQATKPLKEGVPDQRGRKFHAYVTGPRPSMGFPKGLTGSYGLNQWCTLDTAGGRTMALLWGGFPVFAIKDAANVPLLVDCSQGGLTPYHKDVPPMYDGDIYWANPPNINEMKGFCLNRHDGAVNGVFLDFSARKIGLKQLWELHWHRKWYYGKGTVPIYTPPIWPAWMQNFKDYASY